MRPQYGYAIVPEYAAAGLPQVEARMRAALGMAGFTQLMIHVERVDDLFPVEGNDQIPVTPGYVVYAEGEPPL